MNEKQKQILDSDGDDEIIFSQSFNIYTNKLVLQSLREFLDCKFVFIFEKSEPLDQQKDVAVTWNEIMKEATITLSKRTRNSFGGGMDKKLPILKTTDNKIISLSVFAQQFSNDGCLHITITFYAH